MDFLSKFQGDSPVLHFVGFWAAKIYSERETVLMFTHVLLSAVFPIYIGSYASLRCPPSAQEPLKRVKGVVQEGEDDDDDELDEDTPFGGLTPSDAILFPLLAGCVLGSLYVLIKWLDDPSILNKILNYYFSSLGVFGVGTLVTDSLNVGTTFIFPKVWSSGNQLYRVDPLLRQQITDALPNGVVRSGVIHLKFTDKTVPFPGVFSSLKLPKTWCSGIWSFRNLLTDHWILRVYLHGLVGTKTKVRFNNIIGLILGALAVLFYNLNGKPWWLSNIMGWGFCYNTLRFISPTTFWTGSLVLTGLFFYDITMVFYTPMMMTVATKLDVPIKLSIPGPGKGSMLGIGDIVLPGIMVALALRFDLYLFYLRQASVISKSTDESKVKIPENTVYVITEQNNNVKPTYIPATGFWGNSFWTSSLAKDKLPMDVKAAYFPKVYFNASIAGYIIGMLVTFGVLTVFQRGQPALLYLVPGVLGALWGTALIRGEVKEMWGYSEAGFNDEEVKEKGKNVNAMVDGPRRDEMEKIKNKGVELKENETQNEHARHVFLLSLSSPKRGAKN